jgi:hypothetical protein
MSNFQANLKTLTDRAFMVVLGLADKPVLTVILKFENSSVMTSPFLLMPGVALKPVPNICIPVLRFRFINQPSLFGS